MKVYKTPSFVACIEKITKKKYSRIYGTLPYEIDQFFKEYTTFEAIWHKNQMIIEHAHIRLNKIRLENPLQNTGKSGGYRIMVLCDKRDESINLLYVYPKVGPLEIKSLLDTYSKQLVRDFLKSRDSGELVEHELTSPQELGNKIEIITKSLKENNP